MHYFWCKTVNVFHIPLTFYAPQIINPFLDSITSANHYKTNLKILIPLIVPLVYVESLLDK